MNIAVFLSRMKKQRKIFYINYLSSELHITQNVSCIFRFLILYLTFIHYDNNNAFILDINNSIISFNLLIILDLFMAWNFSVILYANFKCTLLCMLNNNQYIIAITSIKSVVFSMHLNPNDRYSVHSSAFKQLSLLHFVMQQFFSYILRNLLRNVW